MKDQPTQLVIQVLWSCPCEHRKGTEKKFKREKESSSLKQPASPPEQRGQARSLQMWYTVSKKTVQKAKYS